MWGRRVGFPQVGRDTLAHSGNTVQGVKGVERLLVTGDTAGAVQAWRVGETLQPAARQPVPVCKPALHTVHWPEQLILHR